MQTLLTKICIVVQKSRFNSPLPSFQVSFSLFYIRKFWSKWFQLCSSQLNLQMKKKNSYCDKGCVAINKTKWEASNRLLNEPFPDQHQNSMAIHVNWTDSTLMQHFSIFDQTINCYRTYPRAELEYWDMMNSKFLICSLFDLQKVIPWRIINTWLWNRWTSDLKRVSTGSWDLKMIWNHLYLPKTVIHKVLLTTGRGTNLWPIKGEWKWYS